MHNGKVPLGRYRSRFAADASVAIAAELAGVCWFGPAPLPFDLGPRVLRSEGALDSEGRLYLPIDLRKRLAVSDPNRFCALVVPAPAGGVLLVPMEGFARRVGVVG